jgi:hypothetical protein
MDVCHCGYMLFLVDSKQIEECDQNMEILDGCCALWERCVFLWKMK